MKIKSNSGSSILGFLASLVFAVLLIWLSVFLFNYFSQAKSDITAKDNVIEVLNQGTGTGAKNGDTVTINYIGALSDGTEFDNSYKRKEPITVIIGEGKTIAGFEKGLLGIKKGEKRKVVIPPALGYGEAGVPDQNGGYVIPPNSSLVFTIEAISVSSHGYLQ